MTMSGFNSVAFFGMLNSCRHLKWKGIASEIGTICWLTIVFGILDEETSHKVETLLFDLNKDAGTTLVLVTHDLELAKKTQKIIKLRGGKLDN